MTSRPQNLLGLVLLLAFTLAGCNTAGPCSGDCPSIAGEFRVLTSELSGSCDFVPMLVDPTLRVEQSADGSQAFIVLTDPVNQLPVRLSLDVLSSGRAGSGSFAGRSRQLRLASRSGSRVVQLEVAIDGGVAVAKDGSRALHGRLITRSLPTAQSQQANAGAIAGGPEARLADLCQVNVTFSATDR